MSRVNGYGYKKMINRSVVVEMAAQEKNVIVPQGRPTFKLRQLKGHVECINMLTNQRTTWCTYAMAYGHINK